VSFVDFAFERGVTGIGGSFLDIASLWIVFSLISHLAHRIEDIGGNVYSHEH
jgi:hypothetical protein